MNRKVVAQLRGYAAGWQRIDRDKASGMQHLADLYEHHGDRRYPSLPIYGSEIVLNVYVPALHHSPAGSPSAQCADAV